MTDGHLADGDGSGVVDDGDYVVWKQHFGTVIGSGAYSAVPEPSSLIAIALVSTISGMCVRKRRGQI